MPSASRLSRFLERPPALFLSSTHPSHIVPALQSAWIAGHDIVDPAQPLLAVDAPFKPATGPRDPRADRRIAAKRSAERVLLDVPYARVRLAVRPSPDGSVGRIIFHKSAGKHRRVIGKGC